MIERLPFEFKGKGDTRNYYFSQVYKRKLDDGTYAYIYSQTDISVDDPYICGYEVIKPQIRRKTYISNENGTPIFKKTENLAELYPSSENWGVYGWTFKCYQDALVKIGKL